MLGAALAGLLAGLACVVARLLFLGVEWSFTGHWGMLPDAARALPGWRRVATPVAGAVLAWAVERVRKSRGGGNGVADYLEAVRERDGRVSWAATAWRTASSAFSVGSGAAIGREGSMIQFAAGCVSGLFGRLQWLDQTLPPRGQIACAVAGAVAAVYQAPVAGVFFALEIVLGSEWRWRWMSALAVASVCGWAISGWALGWGPVFRVSHAGGALVRVRGGAVEHFAVALLAAVAAGLLLGVVAAGYRKLLGSLTQARKLPLALAWGGLAVGALSLLMPEVWGNGDAGLKEVMSGALAGHTPAALSLLAMRLIAVTACVGVGTVGGVFTPTVLVGALLGVSTGSMAGSGWPAGCAVLGTAGLLGGVTLAPIMAAAMAAELTGCWPLLPALLTASVVAARVAKRISPEGLYGIASTVPVRGVRTPS